MANQPAKILIVDDDEAVLRGLKRALVLEGYQVECLSDGEALLNHDELDRVDLLILDVMLPGIDGFTVCGRVKPNFDLPILMLTARDTVPDRVQGLDEGADDYLVKPFAMAELSARVRALLRRHAGPSSQKLEFEDLTLDLVGCEAARAGRFLPLTPLEFQLLTVFMRHPRQVLTREQLCLQVWGYAFEGESNFINVAVMELRHKLEADGRTRLIQTARGFGYALRTEQ